MQISSTSPTSQLIAAQSASDQTSQQIQTAVAKKQLDAQRQAGAAVVQLISSAAQTQNASSSGGVDFYA